MTNTEYAANIYRLVFNVDDGGDAYTHGILEVLKTLSPYEEIAVESRYRYGMTFKQAGERIGGLSELQATHYTKKALRKLRHPSRTRNMSVAAIIERKDILLDAANAKIEDLYNRIEKLLLY